MKILHRQKDMEVWLREKRLMGVFVGNGVVIRRRHRDGTWHWYDEGVVPIERAGESLDDDRKRAMRRGSTRDKNTTRR